MTLFTDEVVRLAQERVAELAERHARKETDIDEIDLLALSQALLAANEAERWIPVGERLPDEPGHYLGYDAGHGAATVFFEHGKFTDCFGWSDAPITHWHFLPPAPKGTK